MKKIISFLFFLSLFSSNICFSQCGWYRTFPYPTDNNLFSVMCVDSNNVFAVGYNGTLLGTTDGGISWKDRLECSKDTINAVQFVDQNSGFAAGTEPSLPARGILYKTTNGGINWIRLTVAENYKINCMQFINSYTGFVSGDGYGGSVLKTTNGGVNWIMYPIGNSFIVKALSFSSPTTGYAAGDIGVFKTTNAGSNWNMVMSYSNGSIRNVYFTNNETGYVCGYHTPIYITPFFVKTTNGGNNWFYPSVPNTSYLRSVYFTNSTTGYACGYGFVIKSTNGGNNWFIQYQDNQSSLNSIDFTGLNTGFAVGFWGMIYKTINEGANWSLLSQLDLMEYVERIKFVNSRTGYAFSGSGILKTTNAGQNWWVLYAPTNPHFQDFFAVDSNLVYVCGGDYLLLRTTNGGLNWTNLFNQSTSYSLNAIAFLNASTGFCSGTGIDKIMLKTTNGGLNWSSQVVNFSAWGAGSIFIVDSNVVYVNSEGQIAKTTTGGADWFLTTPPGTLMHNLSFFDAYTGFSVGYHYRIYKTTNGGTNWSLKVSSTEAYFHSVSFINRDFGFVVGDDGKIGKTTNGGENWFYVSTPTDKHLYAVYMTDTNAIHIGGGYNAVIFKSTNGGIPIGINNIQVEIPSTFFLSQNYPNPFNPVTKIKYDIPAVGQRHAFDVRLAINDILGREIETLVNETQKPGSYEVTWDGSRYASGVYFYRLYADEYVETKKMVLIK